MRKIILLLLLIALALPCFGEATQYNLGSKNTPIPSDWFRTGRYADYGTNWARDIDALVELGANPGTGSIFYVDSGVTNEGDGSSWLNAKNTLDEAVDLCTADAGDVILVAQGHSETMGAAADEVDIDVAGVTVIGLGNGLLRPTFDFTGDVTGAFAISGDDVTIINLRFHANITDVNEAIEVEAGAEQVSIIGCLFDLEAEGTDDFLECIDSSGAASDRLSVIGCEFYMGAGACNSAIYTKDSDYCVIKNNIAVGDYAVAQINNVTTASNHILIAENMLFNATIGGNAGLNAQPCIELVATTTGIIRDNYLVCNHATVAASIVAADCFLFENYYNEDESSAGTGGIIGTASAND